MPNERMKHRWVVHKSTAGILKPIPEAMGLVGNPPPGLTTNTVALLQQRGSANRRSPFAQRRIRKVHPVRECSFHRHIWTQPSKYLSEYLSGESGCGHIFGF